MKISKERQDLLYSAISDPIMNLRIKIKKADSIDKDQVDEFLFALELKLWGDIHQALNIK